MTSTNHFIFQALKVVAWIIFIGLCIEAGALIFNFGFSLIKPEAAGDLYKKLDLSDLYSKNLWGFLGIFSIVIFVAILKAQVFYKVIELVSKIDLQNPFTAFASKKILDISCITLSIAIISHIGRELTRNLEHHAYEIDRLHEFWVDRQAYLLMAGVIYVIGIIFKRGIELQSDSDLTI